MAVCALAGSGALAGETDPPCPQQALHLLRFMETDETKANAQTGSRSQRDDVEPTLVFELIEWIGANSDYDVSSALADPPAVKFCEAGDTLDYEDTVLTVEPHMRGVYDQRRKTIRLVRPWERGNPRNVSTLLHELIHHVQWGKDEWACVQETEWEAYKLQEAFLAEHGLASGFDWLTIFIASRCPDEVHP